MGNKGQWRTLGVDDIRPVGYEFRIKGTTHWYPGDEIYVGSRVTEYHSLVREYRAPVATEVENGNR